MVDDSREESSVKSTKDSAAEISNLLCRIKNAYEYDNVIQDIIQTKMLGQRKPPLNIIKNHVKLELEDYRVINDLLYISNRLYVFDNSKLRTEIIKNIYNISPGGHAGRLFTYNRLSRHYYWSRMTNFVARYIKSCHVYKRSKTYREDKQGLLKSLSILDRY